MPNDVVVSCLLDQRISVDFAAAVARELSNVLAKETAKSRLRRLAVGLVV